MCCKFILAKMFYFYLGAEVLLLSWCRGLSEGWDKILGLYSSVREKGKEIIDQVTNFLHYIFNFQCDIDIFLNLVRKT